MFCGLPFKGIPAAGAGAEAVQRGASRRLSRLRNALMRRSVYLVYGLCEGVPRGGYHHQRSTGGVGVKTRTPYLDFSEKPYSFDLQESMLKLLASELDAETVVGRIAHLDGDAAMRQSFQDYGLKLAQRALQLGNEYPDRAYEVMKRAAEQTGTGSFPSVFQRFVEIAYLGTQPALMALDVIAASRHLFSYRLASCAVFDAIKAKCSQRTVADLPCQAACLSLCDSIAKGLGLDASCLRGRMDASMPDNGYCKVTVEYDST